MKKRNLTSWFILCLTLTLMLSACSNGNTNSSKSDAGNTGNNQSSTNSSSNDSSKETKLLNESGFPIVNEPITLTAMVQLSPAQPTEWNDILVWQRYEEMTGVHIDWDEYTSADIVEKRNLALASDELPDIFYRTRMPNNDIDKYGAEGSFIRLNELIDQYAPNFKALMDKYEGVAKSIATAEGDIYALPNLFDSPSIQINRKLFLNQDWITAVGKQNPTTTEELYELLKAFRDGDPNGNKQQDEIPLTADNLDDIILTLRGAFGLGNRGNTNGNWDIDPVSNQLRYFPTSNQYKELLTYLHKLYDEKLLDQEIFTTSGTEVLAKNEQNRVGIFSFGNVIARANTNADSFAGLDTALAGPNGDRLHTGVVGHLGSRGAFMISKKNAYPEVSMRWIDHLYSEEGIRMLYMGFEGETYAKDANGKYDFLPEIVDNIPEGSSFDQVTAKYVPYAGGSLPTLIMEDYFKGGETQPSAQAASANLRPFIPDEIWESFSYTAAESEEKLTLEADIYGMVRQWTAEFVQGKRSLNEFDSFVSQLERMGLPRLIEIYDAAYQRYQQ